MLKRSVQKHKSSPSYGEYRQFSEEEKLRTIYETQPASEYNRGRLNGLQLVISEIEGLYTPTPEEQLQSSHRQHKTQLPFEIQTTRTGATTAERFQAP